MTYLPEGKPNLQPKRKAHVAMLARQAEEAKEKARAAAQRALGIAKATEILRANPLINRLRRNALKLHAAQKKVIVESKRFNVINCGRRFGKTLMLADLLAETAEKGQPAGYFAPTYKHLLTGWQELKQIAGGALQRVNEQQHRLEFHGGGVVEAWSLDGDQGGGKTKKKFKAARSRKYKRVAIDEAALVDSLEDLFRYAIGPSLIDLKGEAWFCSTPSGKNDFYRLYMYGQDPEKTDWMSWQMPTSMNPYIDPEEIERERVNLPEIVFQQEYLAQFTDDGGAVFRNIIACAKSAGVKEAQQYHSYVMGVDLGRRLDFTVITVMDTSTPIPKVVHMDRFNQIDWGFQVNRIVTACQKYDPDALVVDATGLGDAVVYQLRQALDRAECNVAVNEYVITSLGRREKLLEPLAIAFEREDIEILDPKLCSGELQGIATTLINELESFTQERLDQGHIRYTATQDHDDCAFSLALAWHKAKSGVRMTSRPEKLETQDRIAREMMEAGIPETHPMFSMSVSYRAAELMKEEMEEQRRLMGELDEFEDSYSYQETW